MNYLITGATGFIGRKLVSAPLSSGQRVDYLGRARSRSWIRVLPFIRWNEGELPPLNSVPRHDVVVHLAGEPIAQRWTAQAQKRIHDSRIIGTRDLVSAIGS